MSNFLFLKKNNEKLFNIIADAEKLFRDEYFEQTIIQTRRFAENICRDLLQEKVSTDETFDSMINRIKDNSFGNIRMKEFTDDLYFLKKQGNTSVHSSIACQNGKVALECLERAYEISIFYSNFRYGYNKKLDKAVFSEEVLMTGNKVSSKSLKEKYLTELVKVRENSPNNKTVKKTRGKSKKSQKSKRNFKSKIIMTVFVLVFIVIFSLMILILR